MSAADSPAGAPTEVREACREWLTAKNRYCHATAEVILWGKLFPIEALGPRCYDHATKHVHHSDLFDPQRAIFDLRNLRRDVGRSADTPAVAGSEIQASEPKSAGGDTSTIRAALRGMWVGHPDDATEALDRLAARLEAAESEVVKRNDFDITWEAIHAIRDRADAAEAALGAARRDLQEAIEDRDASAAFAEQFGTVAVGKLEAELRAAREALRALAENAEAWHGPPPDMGHVRALGVIGRHARAVLAGGDNAEREAKDGGRRAAAIEVYRAALVACAEAAGEDMSGGIPSWPALEVWALNAVRELRKDYDEAVGRTLFTAGDAASGIQAVPENQPGPATTPEPPSEHGRLLSFIESVRDLGRGALREAESNNFLALGSAHAGDLSLEDALDIFDRQLDHIEGRIRSVGVPGNEAGSEQA